MDAHGKPRSFTGHHTLLPASNPSLQALGASSGPLLEVPIVPARTLLSWTFGRGSVIWRIWPAVLLHTLFAAVVTWVSMYTKYQLELPAVLLTVLGVVIGFVISYRAMSGYDRYWMGRTCWTDIIRTSRTMARLVWFHVPLLTSPISPGTIPAELGKGDLKRLMKEKREALDLILAFGIAIKHHLRGELGIYYEDLYALVPSMHVHPHVHKHHHVDTTPANPPSEDSANNHHCASPTTQTDPKGKQSLSSHIRDPIIPAINAYGTFDPANPPRRPSSSHSSSSASASSESSRCQESTALLPSSAAAGKGDSGIISKVSSDLIPFANVFVMFRRWIRFKDTHAADHRLIISTAEGDIEAAAGTDVPGQRRDAAVQGVQDGVDAEAEGEGGVERLWRPEIFGGRSDGKRSTGKRHPRVVGGARGENLPLDILRTLSCWCAVLEGRGSVPGTSLGGMIGCIAAFEDSLCTLEKILTTPLPFVYSVHIRHTVWIYLFFLPFQLVAQFGWATVLGTGMAAFIYLGFVAAGEEIEQPFGYDENDLDLDLFCHSIMRVDIERLKNTPCPNVFLGHPVQLQQNVLDSR